MANDFLPFATGGGANVESQATYAADPNLAIGNQPGIASSAFNNKALRQANFVASQVAQLMADQTGTSAVDNGISAQFLAQLKAALLPKAALTTIVTATGAGTFNFPYYFQIASGNATVGATYTNNAVTFTVVATVAGATSVIMTGPGVPASSGTLTKASGTGDATLTFYAVSAPIRLDVTAVGAGGGGAGSGNTGSGSTSGGDGGDTTFGTALISAGGGKGGKNTSNTGGGLGGAASLGSGPVGLALAGGIGAGSIFNSSSNEVAGVSGAASAFGGVGGGDYSVAGRAGAANSGGGGASGAMSAGLTGYTGGGGGSGAYVDCTITGTALAALAGTAAYSVGVGGTGGTAGTSSFAGGAGGSGVLKIVARFQ